MICNHSFWVQIPAGPLSKMKHGFVIEAGKLAKYNNGRKRKNWQSSERQKSRRFLRRYCELCGISENLTIHHNVPLSAAESERHLDYIISTKKNCQTLCDDCHKRVEDWRREARSENLITNRHTELIVLEKGRCGEYSIL